MALSNRTKSILLQVAFKSATDQQFGDNTELMRISDDFYNVLIALHEKHGIDDQSDSSNKASSSQASENRGGAYADVKAAQPIVTIEGVQYRDLRSAKEFGLLGDNNPPEFERVSDGKGFWLAKRDGSPTKLAGTVAALGV